MLDKNKIDWVEAQSKLVITKSEVPDLVIITDYLDESPSLDALLNRVEDDVKGQYISETGIGSLWIQWNTSNYHVIFNEDDVLHVVDLDSICPESMHPESEIVVLAWSKIRGV